MRSRPNVHGKPPRLLLPFLASLLVAGSAWGFAYIINEGTGLPIKWTETPARMRLMLGSSPGGVDFNAAATAAATDWNNFMGSLRISPETASGTATDRNGQNEMVFAPNVFGKAFDDNVLAVTTTWHRGNERTEADIIFNTARTWGVYNGPTQSGSTDLRRVALHELGHALGLDHPDEAGQNFPPPVPIMNSRITGNDTLTSDDITAVQNLYGPPGTPANDSFANAIALTLVFQNGTNTATASGHNTNATKQAGEPAHASNAGGRSVWWKWTAPTTGSVSVNTRGSYFDTTVGIYTGSSVAALTPIASNDDIDPGVVQASNLSFNATGGTTYFIAIDGFDADSAGITLNLTFDPNALSLTTQPVNQTVTTGGSVTFTVVAVGPGTLSYQWFFGNGAIAGANSATLSLSNVQAANAGSYFVTVTNGPGTVTSNTVTLTVNSPVPPPAPAPAPPPSSGGGGGGGAPSLWFYGALSLLILARFARRR